MLGASDPELRARVAAQQAELEKLVLAKDAALRASLAE
jgi:hypothetical protein